MGQIGEERSRKIPPRESRGRVLIVDDDRDLAEATAEALREMRYDAATAYGADAALDRLAGFDPEVALLDIRLGKTDGLGLIEALRKGNPQLLCVIVTAYGDVSSAVEALRKGAYDYLQKPVDMNVLGAVLERCFDHLRLEREKAAAEAALQRSEARFRDLIAGSIQGVLVHRNLKPLFANDAYAKIFGYQRAEEILALDSIAPLIDPDERSRVTEIGAARLAGEDVPPCYEYRGVRRDGTVIWLANTARVVDWEDGTAIQSVVVDVTDQKLAEKALKEREALLRAIIDNSPSTITLKDTAGRLLLVNSAFERIYGVPRRKALGKDAAEFVTDGHAEIGRRHNRRVLETLQPHTEERDVRLPGGRRFCSIVTKFPVFHPDGRLMGLGTISTDITALKRTEEALRASEARLAGIVDIAPEAVITVDAEQRIQLFNQGAETIFGYASSEVVGRPLEILIPERFRIVHREHFEAFARSRGASRTMNERGEISGLRKDGSEFPAEASISRLDLGSEVVFTVILRDITERKEAEAALQRGEELLRLVIDSLPVQIAYLDAEERFVLVNRTCARWCGADPDEIIGRTVAEICGDQYNLFASHLAEVRAGREVTFEQQVRYPDGIAREVRTILVPNIDADRGVVGFINLTEDITEAKRAQHALRESEERLRGIIDNSPSAIVLKDLKGRYRLVNRQYEKWYGVSEADVIGKTSRDLFPPEAAEAFVDHDRQVLETGQPSTREQNVTFADGAMHRLVITRFPVFGSDGRPIGVGVINHDVTEQRRAEDRLRQAQKMEAVGQLTGGIAHDFNNLLTIVLSNLELLTERLSDEGRLRRLAHTALDAVRRGGELTQRLLAFSRQQPLEPHAVDLGELVDGMTDLLRRTLGEGIEVRVRRAEDLWLCRADPTQVENALLNLAINARDAMPKGGTITIETVNVTFSDSAGTVGRLDLAPGEYVLLSVSDTGRGMPPEIVERAFEPFFTTKEMGKGSGLGLSMIYGFVKQSGGDVDIDSRAGYGTTVRIYLPRAENGERSSPPVRPDGAVRTAESGETILVVEDDPIVSGVLADLIASMGYRVEAVEDGKSALAVLEHTDRIDLMLVDVMLPGEISGPELARMAQRRWPSLKVVFTSGYGPEELHHQGGLEKGVRVLHKPYQKHELANRLREVLGGKGGQK